jgi:uridine phosphorylase
MTYDAGLPPILEFDPNPRAMINADEHYHPLDIPKSVVFCFFYEIIDKLVSDGLAREVHAMRSELGRHPLYAVRMPDGQEIGLMHPGVGAPLAAALLEEVSAHGARNFIAVGGAGSLRKELTLGHVVVPTKALRDEGVSYHYVAPSRWIDAQSDVNLLITSVLDKHDLPYVLGPTWTTDAFYRETPAKVERRRNEGCLTVEMETSAFLAVCHMRNLRFGQILYSADDLSGTEWDGRGWHHRASLREQLTFLAAEIATLM